MIGYDHNYFGLTLNYNRTYNKILQNIKVLMTIYFVRKQRLFINLIMHKLKGKKLNMKLVLFRTTTTVRKNLKQQNKHNIEIIRVR